MKSREYIIAAIAVVALFTGCSDSGPSEQSNQYYGFFESDKGPSYKRFQHNIFGFEIDIPAKWTFGVVGTGPGAIVMIYSPELDTSQFSAGYSTLNIGVIPVQGVGLEAYYEAIMRGMTQNHEGLTITAGPESNTINGMAGLRFGFNWPSKTGLTVSEDVRLVKKGDTVYSVTVRSVPPVRNEVATEYDEAISTFEIL